VSTPMAMTPPSMQDGGKAMLEWVRRMRDERPVWQDPRGIWHVFRFDDVQRVMSDHSVFSSDRTRVLPNAVNLDRGNVVAMDPPEHRQVRQLISQAFAPRVITGLAPRIEQVTQELLSSAMESEEFDVVDDLAYPLPVIVIAELLGIPASDRGMFRAWADRLLSMQVERGNPEFLRALDEALREMREYFTQEYARRLASPGHDLISNLMRAEGHGRRLDKEEVVNFSVQLLLAGHVSTTVLLANLILCLYRNSEAQSAVRADRSLVPAALEETIRHHTPSMQLGRITKETVQLSGVTLPPNAIVAAWLLSANHDERHFTQPERFDIYRKPNDHISFGYGIHFCIGAALARQEAEITINSIFDRLQTLELSNPDDLKYHDNGIMFGPKNLRLVVHP
jgi:cytochrome P450